MSTNVSLSGDLGYQVQESVIASKYVQTEEEANCYETFISCDTTDKHKVANVIEQNGFTDYTITNGGVSLLDFKNESNDFESDEELDVKYANVIHELNAKSVGHSYMDSRLLEVKDRIKIYETILNDLLNANRSTRKTPQGLGTSGFEVAGLQRSERERLRDVITKAKQNLEEFGRNQGAKGRTLESLDQSLGDWIDAEDYLTVSDNARAAYKRTVS